jgi:acyl-CoA thioesterase-1
MGSPVILIMGDSLSAAHGINPNQGWVTLLQNRLQSYRLDYKIINASIGGNTTRNGLEALAALLKDYQPDIVIIGLGSNDGLRGLSTIAMKKNLKDMIQLSEQNHAKVLLIGFLIPLNYGPVYRTQFEQVFKTLSQEYHLPTVPFLLEKVVLNPTLMQSDGLHPNEEAQPIILDTLWPYLEPLLMGMPRQMK